MCLLGLRRGCRIWPRRLLSVAVDINVHAHCRGQLWLSKTRREYSASHHEPSIERTRNIGIIAHIDAGKTTTTERMLYYSGYTRRIGDVDEGSTITDFLPAERARGITIQSAAVTLAWPPFTNEVPKPIADAPKSHVPHTINLIDTPGHADFTFEVLRSLRILDGAVCILDGVAGVEAQTEKVWAQANNYSIPRIIFVNKLDRDGAAFERTIKQIGTRLRGWPAVCQIPWWEGGKGKFTGVGDAINLCALKWKEGGDGKSIEKFDLKELMQEDTGLREEVLKARSALVEVLCEFDEHLLTTWMDCGDDALAVPAQAIRDSLRRCTLDGSGRLIPVFAGASFRNIGVQPLLDAVDDYLPNPTERPDPEISLGSQKASLPDLLSGKVSAAATGGKQVMKKGHSPQAVVAHIAACALAFKVVNDARRGVLVYVRVYSGSIKRNTPLWNTSLHVTEPAQRLLQMQASDAVEISHIPAGQIGVIAGLKHARTGDTLISYPGVNPKTGPPAPLSTLQLRPIDVPPPVFFAAIEPHSLSEEKNVKDLLQLMLREDPSLHVNVDEESGQMLLSGMGELHLEIARDRLVNDFKAKVTMGNIEISYRECVLSPTSANRVLFDREVAGKKGKAACEASIEPFNEFSTPSNHTVERDGNHITVRLPNSWEEGTSEGQTLPLDLPLALLQSALINGAAAALARGPRRAFPLHSNHVILKFDPVSDIFGSDTSPAALSSASRLAVKAALEEAFANDSIGLMEPVMNVVISCNEGTLGAIVHDLSSARGGHVLSLENDGNEDSSSDNPSIDVNRIYAPPDPFASSGSTNAAGPGQQRQVTARVPLKEMVGYLKHLRSLTGGRGTFVMSVDKFERLSGPREKAV
ncbi:Ribosome-releasing factor, mitochondrial [Lachnellula hyalina]|uniref:Ribosome-releasing factor 2, mitochondrial n=1 Tax=Lachnellula hyalina TaxID=1316788 RepID=A0A8H8R0C2_9HELO|nr:Ribosome-releasing factor, mitochondrial [Lachnellula hyalina]TVY26222.1 Ribosome-releasing factor, mitochondrial [Lachnellula hyalina]